MARGWLLSCLLLSLACAATEGPPAPRAASPRPESPVAMRPPPPPPPHAEAEAAEPEPASLVVAREVLESEAEALSPDEREGVARQLVRAEREHGLPVLMLLALIEHESRFDPRAVGPRGARGLMQIRPFVGRAQARRLELAWRGPDMLFHPVANVRIGVSYLARQLHAFGSPELALAAYNLGPTRLRRRLARDAHPTPVYVHRILQGYHALRLRYGDPETAVGG